MSSTASLDRRPDGGPAFPRDSHVESDGMTLRDYFAAKAMNGLLMADDSRLELVTTKNLAEASYALADAMLRAKKL